MALDAIEEIFNAYRTGLLKIDEDTDPAVAYNHCGVVTSALFEYTPFLGFLTDRRMRVMRSSCIAHCFEWRAR